MTARAALALAALVAGGPALSPATLADVPERAGSSAWDGRSRVVHEWGTFTGVLGSDGVALEGLVHEDGSLPDFVLDAADRFALTGASPKMETPVLYLYSPDRWPVRVRAEFPRGAITQWFPPASRVNGGSRGGPAPEPADGGGSLGRPQLPLRGGAIEWGRGGELCALARGERVELLPVAPDDPWRFARDVAANTVQVRGLMAAGGEVVEDVVRERFLFYRGLGDFPLPVRAEVASVRREGTAVRLRATLAGSDGVLRSPFLIHVDGDHAGYLPLPALGRRPLELDAAIELRRRADVERELVVDVARALAETGLYADEALAMVRTWQHAWLGDEGLRLIAILPRAFVDRELPLEVEPAVMVTREGVVVGASPDELVRTFVGRVELLSPERETAILETLERAAGGDPTARETAAAWGRFRAPFEARAQALLRAGRRDPAADAAESPARGLASPRAEVTPGARP